MRTKLATVALAVALCGIGSAKPMPTYTQSHYNCQLQCQDLAGVASQLEKLVQENGGMITNMNTDLQNGSGNLNVRIPEENLGKFSEGLRALGSIQNQNRSMSDNTNSYSEARRQLEVAEKMAAAKWSVSGSNLSETEKGLFEAEFKAYLRDRINNYRSNMQNYENNRGWAEASVSLMSQNRSQPGHHRHRRHQEEASQPDPVAEPPQKPEVPQQQYVGMAVFGPVIVFMGLLGCYLMVRNQKRDRNVGE